MAKRSWISTGDDGSEINPPKRNSRKPLSAKSKRFHIVTAGVALVGVAAGGRELYRDVSDVNAAEAVFDIGAIAAAASTAVYLGSRMTKNHLNPKNASDNSSAFMLGLAGSSVILAGGWIAGGGPELFEGNDSTQSTTVRESPATTMPGAVTPPNTDAQQGSPEDAEPEESYIDNDGTINLPLSNIIYDIGDGMCMDSGPIAVLDGDTVWDITAEEAIFKDLSLTERTILIESSPGMREPIYPGDSLRFECP